MEYILIANDPDIAMYAQECGVHRIMVDLEIKGKRERQGHLDTVISSHSIDDVRRVRQVLVKSKLLVRVNPIDEESKEEIDRVVDAGADIIMLPMFKSPVEVEKFISYIDGRCRNCLLLETPAAVARINQIVEIPGINEIHVGLNDLHLGFGLNFMFELLSGGIVEYLSEKINDAGLSFGFGGIARLGRGAIDASLILGEHVRLNSKLVILSRDFYKGISNSEEFKTKVDLKGELDKMNDYLNYLKSLPLNELNDRRTQLVKLVNDFCYKH